MRAILFCQNNYAFGILNPIKEVLIDKGYEYLWFIPEKISSSFPYKFDNYTTSITRLKQFSSDAIFVPGNEVPYYLRGLKVQIFHGLAGEKKGHFRIRHYFDLYLTQGPYFTKKFNELKDIHRDFDVIETGWPKLDVYAEDKTRYKKEKDEILKRYVAKTIILYAPTFSPKLTSAPFLINQITELAKNSDYVILLKFHPLMDNKLIKIYNDLANLHENIIFQPENNIIKFLLIADILISDTSSVIYEFLLLDKPVITFRNISDFKKYWHDSDDYNNLIGLVEANIRKDPFAKNRKLINGLFHPYNDGQSALRMVESTENYIKANGVPTKRKLSFLRRLKIHKIFR